MPVARPAQAHGHEKARREMWEREASLLRVASSKVHNDEVKDSPNTPGASGSASGDRGYDASDAVDEVGLTHEQKRNRRRRLMHEARCKPLPDN